MVHRVSPARLSRLLSAVLAASGAPDDLAAEVADVLVANELVGHQSHGAIRLGQYVKEIEDGIVLPTARPVVVDQEGAAALVDGAWGFGQVAASVATTLLVEKAKEHKVSAVAVVRANHTGRLAIWSERAARDGVVMMMFIGTVGRQLMAPYGGSRGVLGTNPISVSVPNPDGAPITLDYATSAIANGKIMVAEAEGQSIPPETTLDKHGRPTTDPAQFSDGGFLLPFGGHKGYALAVVAELLGNAVAGGSMREGQPYSGILMVGIAQDAFRTSDEFGASLLDVVSRLTSVPPREGFDEVLLPGMPEARRREQQADHDISIGAATWRSLMELADRKGVDLSSVAGSTSGRTPLHEQTPIQCPS